MSTIKKEPQTALPERRRFLWHISLFSACAAAIGLPFLNKKTQKRQAQGKAVKMLTEDGRLVEVDASFLTSATKKATNAELQHWVKTK